MICAENLTFTFAGSNAAALCNINLHLKQGGFTIVNGPSGCGKSSLALSAAGFIPHAFPGDLLGTVLVDGQDTRSTTVYALARKVGLVQQDPEAQLCTLTVDDEVAFGPENLGLPRPAIADRVERALAATGISHLRERAVHTLSGGEKQKLATAAALALGPSCLVLDEPMANLDPTAAQAMLETLNSLRKQGATLLLFEHRFWPACQFGDEVCLMDKGRVVWLGPCQALDSDEDKAEALGFRPRSLGKKRLRSSSVFDGPPALEVSGLSLDYGVSHILDRVDLQVRRGEIVALMGDNGSGKSSLLLALLGLVKPTAGRVFVTGEELTQAPASVRARRLGLIFQNPNHQLFTSSVLEEILVSTPGDYAARHRANTLMQRFDIIAKSGDHPQTLSMGQKRRLTIAAALVNKPDVLLLDEPFVGQDFRQIQALMVEISSLAAEGTGVLLVCHDPDLVAAYADRVVLLESGRITVDVPPATAFAKMLDRGLHAYVPYRQDEREHVRPENQS